MSDSETDHTDYGEIRQKPEDLKQHINSKIVPALAVGSLIFAFTWFIVAVLTAPPIFYDVMGGREGNNINETYHFYLGRPCGVWILILTLFSLLTGAFLARYKGITIGAVFVLLIYGVSWFACPWLWGASLGLPVQLIISALILMTLLAMPLGSVWLIRRYQKYYL